MPPDAQTEVAARQATASSPQNPNRSRSLPNHDLKPPEPKQRPWLARPRPQVPRTQTEVAVCQTTTSSPQNPNRSHSLPGHNLKPPEPNKESQPAKPRPRCPLMPKQKSKLARLRPQAPRTQTKVAACRATTSSPQNPNRSRRLPNHDRKSPEPKQRSQFARPSRP
ncbi:hypothetical protein B0H11DRAFT_487714 [Mycena galericulata]|nr:hypothetical protein B0H11DRAFT_487714 [Mycena galericulata]